MFYFNTVVCCQCGTCCELVVSVYIISISMIRKKKAVKSLTRSTLIKCRDLGHIFYVGYPVSRNFSIDFYLHYEG